MSIKTLFGFYHVLFGFLPFVWLLPPTKRLEAPRDVEDLSLFVRHHGEWIGFLIIDGPKLHMVMNGCACVRFLDATTTNKKNQRETEKGRLGDVSAVAFPAFRVFRRDSQSHKFRS